MKRKILRFSLLAGASLLAFGALGLASCSSGNSFAPASVRLNVSELSLKLGESERLRVSVTKGYSGELRWFSSNENVVLVDDGYVFGVGIGKAKITAAFAGGYAECLITVSAGEGEQQVDRLSISPTSRTIAVGGTFTIRTSIYPTDATVSFSSSAQGVASVSDAGVVTGISVGSAVITVTGSNGKVATCDVTVSDSGQGGDDSGRDIAVGTDLGYTGSLTIGSPKIQRSFMEAMLKDFNEKTNSSIEFTITEFNEDNGTSGYSSAASMPAVFPYASDQTLTLYQFGALSSVSKTDYNWIKSEMGNSAYEAARLNSCVGYPFAADNGVVMFYNTDYVSNVTQIDTIDEIFDLAEERDLEVNYAVGTGFYAAGALMTFSGGKSFYSLTPTDTSYSSRSSFNCEAGLQAAKLIKSMTSENTIRNAATAPTKDVLVTITDVSKVRDFKTQMGSKYAVAPLPFVDAAMTTRIGSYLGYKFYGVNNQLTKDDKTKAAAVAKFLCSEYAQAKRFDEYQVRPTLLSLEDYAKDEPHVAALIAESKTNSTIPLTAIASELWSQTASAVTSIKALDASAPDSEYQKILSALDSALTK